MLVLTRRLGQKILIGDGIEVVRIIHGMRDLDRIFGSNLNEDDET